MQGISDFERHADLQVVSNDVRDGRVCELIDDYLRQKDRLAAHLHNADESLPGEKQQIKEIEADLLNAFDTLIRSSKGNPASVAGKLRFLQAYLTLECDAPEYLVNAINEVQDQLELLLGLVPDRPVR